ncbi:hypothetical protein SBC1_06910 [Caballeronia sp. SBC1]|nr:hypothetical protein SBC2_06970 [Caballeronia sp. SBC2]QIN60714.1 hypothetical protein SBC1_06910 [Caballeronia sp. SBC1]
MPEIIAAASLPKTKMGAATSSGSANHLSAMPFNAGSRLASSLHAVIAIGASVTIGLMLFT